MTWAIGHLVGLAEPHDIDARWKRWRLADLPILPGRWPLVVLEPTRASSRSSAPLLNAPDIECVVCATDAGREGELIFRYVYEAARCKKPVRRLWISSLTPDAIARGFRELKDGSAYDELARAARARSRADWLVGMNLSRAYSVAHDEMFSVGRVQTPDAGHRRRARARDPRVRSRGLPGDRREVSPDVDTTSAGRAGAAREEYRGVYLGHGGARPRAPARLPPGGEEAARIVARVERGTARVETVERESHTLPPPLLYDLTELQRHANRLYGMSAQRTLDVAQTLYEKQKAPQLSPHRQPPPLGERGGDAARRSSRRSPRRTGPSSRRPQRHAPSALASSTTARVTDHHAIIPTTQAANWAALTADERRIYDLVCRRLLSAWHEDHVYATTTVVTAVASGPAESVVDRFVSSGTSIERVGWKVLDVRTTRRDADAPPSIPPGLVSGERVAVDEVKSAARKTRPPPRFTDATLLTAMETAGRTLEEKELSAAMRDSGLGTPATRAATSRRSSGASTCGATARRCRRPTRGSPSSRRCTRT